MVNQCKSSIGHLLPIITPWYQDNEIPKYISQYVPIIKSIIHLLSSYIPLSQQTFQIAQGGAPQLYTGYNPITYRYITNKNHSDIGLINQLSYHRSAIKPMESQFSYSFPMFFFQFR